VPERLQTQASGIIQQRSTPTRYQPKANGMQRGLARTNIRVSEAEPGRRPQNRPLPLVYPGGSTPRPGERCAMAHGAGSTAATAPWQRASTRSRRQPEIVSSLRYVIHMSHSSEYCRRMYRGACFSADCRQENRLARRHVSARGIWAAQAGGQQYARRQHGYGAVVAFAAAGPRSVRGQGRTRAECPMARNGACARCRRSPGRRLNMMAPAIGSHMMRGTYAPPPAAINAPRCECARRATHGCRRVPCRWQRSLFIDSVRAELRNGAVKRQC